MSATPPDLNALRSALLELPSSGPGGFEGLLATVFAKLLGVPFRLAKSGSQFGVDGKTSDPAFPVAFEAKRYQGDVPTTEVLNKIGALAIRDDPVELWILGTTGTVASQVADDLESLAGLHGFATLILDWQPDAPRLAAVLMEAHEEVGAFLVRNLRSTELATNALTELNPNSGLLDLKSLAQSVLSQMRTASVAAPMAQCANRKWLVETLSHRLRAKSRLGQVLTPLVTGGTPVLARSRLHDQLQAELCELPKARLVAVLGDEGNGKSWLAMKASVELPSAPLVVLFSPEEFVTIPEGVDWDEIFARKLLTQTGESISEKTEARWRRRFGRWRSAGVTRSPRLVVLVDGLNQRPSVNWGRHIDSLVLQTSELGGCTVVTSRSEYFGRYVQPRLDSPIISVVVPQWTDLERDQVLAESRVTGANLQPAVADALRNPRLLGVALTLLDADILESLEALSVPWLLFEHLRMLDKERSDGHSAADFAHMLQSDAKAILLRVRSEVTDDLTVFERLEPAAEGRFFQWVEGEPNRYTLREQGLTYALGLAIIEELRAAVRTGRDVPEALRVVLEPIAALDQTADATIAAMTIACLDQQVSERIGTAIIVGFSQLQNPNGALLAPFIEIARHRASIFCEASEAIWMTSAPAPNADWLESALHVIKRRTDVWKTMQPFLGKWLRYWWPDIRVAYKIECAQGSPTDAQRDAESEHKHRIDNLSEVEHEYLAKLIRQQANPYRLVRLALQICAGMPLESLGASLTCLSFSTALTPTPSSPHDELSSLVLFNRRDWSATREQLISHATRLALPETSESGKWAAVTLLRATGSLADSLVASDLLHELNRDRGLFCSWRRVESYCATDPCDPESDRPENIDDTAIKYAQIDVSKLYVFMGRNEHDHFLEKALPGLARFSPAVAVGKHCEFLASIPGRRGLPLRQSTWSALDNAALIDERLAARFLTLSTSLAFDHAEVDEASVRHVQQSLLRAILPHLSPQEQFAGIDALPDPNQISLELLRLVRDGSPTWLMEIARLRDPSDLRAAVPLIVACHIAKAPLPGFASTLPQWLASPHPLVRLAGLQLAAVTGDPEALTVVVASAWTASGAPWSSRERFIGSAALIAAASRGLVAGSEIIPRIAPEFFGVACAELDGPSGGLLAVMLDECVRAASQCDVRMPRLEITLAIRRATDAAGARHSLQEVVSSPKSFGDLQVGQSEGESEFQVRQARLFDGYEAFRNQLTPQTAAVILEAFRFNDMQFIMRVAPGVVQGWIELLRGAAKARSSALRNFGLCLASALTHSAKSAEGIELLALLQSGTSFVQVRYTQASLHLESIAVWQAADCEKVNKLRFARLDACLNDQEISLEAAAAIFANKGVILKAYAQERCISLLPIDVARAFTVAGFADDPNFASEVVAGVDGDDGLLVTAALSSRYAMDRYRWSKHWFDTMLTADNEESFWTASVLFLKVVDARFEAEWRDAPVGTKVFNTWWWSVERRLQRRFGRWADKRKKTLFGSKVPDSIYLQ